MKAIRIGIAPAGAHAARRTLAAHDEGFDAELNEMRQQRRPVERAGALLGDDDVPRLRLELGADVVVGRIERRPVALGGRDEPWLAPRAGVTRRVEDR